MPKTVINLLFAALIPACAASSASNGPAPQAESAPTAAREAVSTLRALGESQVTGIIRFTEVADGVQVTAEITGLSPEGVHGFHIHEKGDCSSPDGKSAGGHFNPANVEHGGPDGHPSHIGDLGNLTADAEGKAGLTLVKAGATLGNGPNNIVGRGLIVHAQADDLKSQPTGAAGGRIACGVIEAAQ